MKVPDVATLAGWAGSMLVTASAGAWLHLYAHWRVGDRLVGGTLTAFLLTLLATSVLVYASFLVSEGGPLGLLLAAAAGVAGLALLPGMGHPELLPTFAHLVTALSLVVAGVCGVAALVSGRRRP